MTSHNQPHFYLSRQGKPHGPLPWSEIRSYLAYGSVSQAELLSPDGSKDWRSLEEWRKVIEGAQASQDEGQGLTRKLMGFLAAIGRGLRPSTADADLPRRRAVRFREWEHVPEKQRSSRVVSDLLAGFLFFPPRLWSASSRVFSQHVFRRSTDEAGFLKVWPQGAETFCTVLILINALWWAVLTVLFMSHGLPVLREAVLTFQDSFKP